MFIWVKTITRYSKKMHTSFYLLISKHLAWVTKYIKMVFIWFNFIVYAKSNNYNRFIIHFCAVNLLVFHFTDINETGITDLIFKSPWNFTVWIPILNFTKIITKIVKIYIRLLPCMLKSTRWYFSFFKHFGNGSRHTI